MNEDNTNDVELDLDALAPKGAKIQFKGQQIQVEPPTVEQYILLTEYSQEIKTLQDEGKVAETAPVYTKVKEIIVAAIPQLADTNLGIFQIPGLVGLLLKLGQPTGDKATAELAKHGVTMRQDATAKKAKASPTQ